MSWRIATSSEDKLTVGGKGYNLFRLEAIGMNVPPFVVVPNDTLQHALQNVSGVADIENIHIPEEYLNAILQHFKNVKYFAVRSSAIDEDGGDFSFAGQFESHLFVLPHELQEAIKKVWKSGYSERVIAYRKNNQLAPTKGIAVVIQEMIDSEKSGVAFTANPVSGHRDEMVISAVFGLGEGLVSGELDADNYTISPIKTEKQIVSKTHYLGFDQSGGKGTAKYDLPISKKESAVLSDDEIRTIVAQLQRLQRHLVKPQDVEWTFGNGQFYLLQTRPITSLAKLADPDGELIVWDNSNIIESYPGLSSPLTFSFITKMYEAVYRQMCGIMGVEEKEIEENRHVFANMLGLINGRVYYNLLSWYKTLALLPGYDLNAEFMERMMGVKERFELKDRKTRSRASERWRVVKMVRIMIRNYRQLHESRITFQKEFNEVMEKFDAIDLNTKRAEELMHLYHEFEQTLLKKWKAPLVNDFFAMIFFGVTQKLTEKYELPSGIHNDLLCGARDIISTEPIHRSLRIAGLIQRNEACKSLFTKEKPSDILKQIDAFPEIASEINAYIHKFGERCVGELKLETITYKQQPADFIKIIQAYVQQGVNESTPKNTDLEMRKNAENTVSATLKGKWFKKKIFHFFLSRARVLVSARENLRFERTRGFGKVREIFCAIGRLIYKEGILQHERDIFFLTKEEIFDYISGTAVTQDLTTLVSLRKAQYSAYEHQHTAERIRTKGMVYHGNAFDASQHNIELKGDLRGIGCCPGRVKARVQVIHNPSEVENLNGDILVTSSTDPGWVTLFPTASAIMVERGSLLSHSAIVSREMGKPCIVGVSGLLQQLRTGDIVEMDGATGEIKIVERNALSS